MVWIRAEREATIFGRRCELRPARFSRVRSPPMASEWFYREGSQVVGPISGTDLRQLARSCQITPETLVRKGADGPWIGASKVVGLIDRPAEAPVRHPRPRVRSRPEVPRRPRAGFGASSATARITGRQRVPTGCYRSCS